MPTPNNGMEDEELKESELKYNVLVRAIYPDAVENPERIVTAFIKLEINNSLIVGFVPEWINYFHSPKRMKYPFGDGKLIEFLLGKPIKIIIRFLGFENEDRIFNKSKYCINPFQRKGRYVIIGKVLAKVPYPPDSTRYEYLILDTGLKIFHSAVRKGKYQLGDFIISKGRLDFEIIHLPSIMNIPGRTFKSRTEKLLTGAECAPFSGHIE